MSTSCSRKNGFVIAIDGPAGSGKSTVSRMVAERLNYLYVDTGAMYRALTWKALNEKLDLEDEKGLAKLAKGISIRLRKDRKVFVDNIDVTTEIRSPEVTDSAFYIARVPEVRECMVAQQREIGKDGGVVLEGRDIGTVVFPDADTKIYLHAEIRERARRRYKELNEKGYRVKIEEVEKELRSRDQKDKGRKVAPLRVADKAVIIDTTQMSIDQVVKEILKLVPSHHAGSLDVPCSTGTKKQADIEGNRQI